jgi:DNA-binding response OmpR family regulator
MPEKILVIDDEEMIRNILSECLELSGYEVVTATDGDELLPAVKKHNPDLILMDVEMQRMSGFDAAKNLQKDPDHTRIPIIFVTGLDEIDERTHGFKVGAVDYIVKPFDTVELVARVECVLKRDKIALENTENARIQTLSQLMVTIAHYINNSVAGMQGHAEIVNVNKPEQVERLQQVVLQSCGKITAVVDSLKEMAGNKMIVFGDYIDHEDAMLDIQDRLREKIEKKNQTN